MLSPLAALRGVREGLATAGKPATDAESILSIWQALGYAVPVLGLFDADQLTVNGSNEVTNATNAGDQGLGDFTQWLGPPFPLSLPTYDATGINSQPAIYFDDTSGGRKILSTPSFDATTFDGGALFVVARDTETATAQVAGFGEEGAAYDAGSLRLDVNTSNEWVSSIAEDSSDVTAIANATSQALTAPSVVTCTIDYDAMPRATVRMDGVELADSVANAPTGPLGNLPIIMGGRPSSSARSWGPGWISAIVLVMRPNTDSAPIPTAALAATEAILANFRGL